MNILCTFHIFMYGYVTFPSNTKNSGNINYLFAHS